MKSKKFLLFRIVVLLVLCIAITSCWHQKTLKIVPIREAEFRTEHDLPLDDLEIEAVVEFIADGGRQKNDGFHASVEHEHFERFLKFFKNETNLTYGTFVALPKLKEFINPETPVYDVIDARECEGAYRNNRLAYRYKDFWFVLMVDRLKDESGNYILDREKKFSRIIVIQVLERAEKTK